jgi:hypothetical protein
MPPNDAARRLARMALDFHAARLIELQDTPPDAGGRVADDLRIAVCDALGWAARIHDRNVKRRAVQGVDHPERDNRLHVMWGATWARNRIIHQDANLLEMRHEQASYNAPVSWNARLPYNAKGITYLREMPDEVPDDERPYLRPFYNECVAGRYVLDVCDLLAEDDPDP